MIKARLYLPLLLLFFLLFLSCKKDEKNTPQTGGYQHYDTHPTIDTSCKLNSNLVTIQITYHTKKITLGIIVLDLP